MRVVFRGGPIDGRISGDGKEVSDGTDKLLVPWLPGGGATTYWHESSGPIFRCAVYVRTDERDGESVVFRYDREIQ
jgi:hypothetical protein